jgi:hypothetical protein
VCYLDLSIRFPSKERPTIDVLSQSPEMLHLVHKIPELLSTRGFFKAKLGFIL